MLQLLSRTVIHAEATRSATGAADVCVAYRGNLGGAPTARLTPEAANGIDLGTDTSTLASLQRRLLGCTWLEQEEAESEAARTRNIALV